MDKKEFQVLIKHCFLMEKNTVEPKQWLDKRYKDSAPGKSTIIEKKSSAEWTEWSEATKDLTVDWQGYSIRILGRAWYFVYRVS